MTERLPSPLTHGSAIPLIKPGSAVQTNESTSEITRLFLDDSVELMRRIRSAVDARDSPALERAAHTLRGAAANFAAQEVIDVVLTLEEMARLSDLSGVDDAWQLLDREVSRLRHALAASASGRSS